MFLQDSALGEASLGVFTCPSVSVGGVMNMGNPQWGWMDFRHILGSVMVMVNTCHLKSPGAFPFGFFATNLNFGEERPGPPQVLSQNGLACYKLLFVQP